MTLMLHKLSAYGLSNRGLVRQNNEDYWDILAEKQFYVLADGMGGHQAGEVASKLAVEKVCEIIGENWDSSQYNLEDAKEFLQNAIQVANAAVYEQSLQNPEFRGMGTTICCLLFHTDGIIYGHVGDSRIYRLRKRKLIPLTEDHSLLREMRDNGINNHTQYKHVLTKAVGTEGVVEASLGDSGVIPGDIYLMCSDGLTDLLSDEDIEAVLKDNSVSKAPSQLIEIAKERGGHDNITIVLVKVHETNLSRQ